VGKARRISTAIYTGLLIVPFGFWILGIIFAIKALKAGNLSQFKHDIKAMFYQSSQN